MAQLARVLAAIFEEGGMHLHGRIGQVLIETTYNYSQNNQVHTADLLGMSRNVLRTQLKRFGLLAGAQISDNERSFHDTFDRPGLSARSTETV